MQREPPDEERLSRYLHSCCRFSAAPGDEPTLRGMGRGALIPHVISADDEKPSSFCLPQNSCLLLPVSGLSSFGAGNITPCHTLLRRRCIRKCSAGEGEPTGGPHSSVSDCTLAGSPAACCVASRRSCQVSRLQLQKPNQANGGATCTYSSLLCLAPASHVRFASRSCG